MYMCFCVCLCSCVWINMCATECGSQITFQKLCLPLLAWSSAISLGWQASKPQGSFCLNFPSAEITIIFNHTQAFLLGCQRLNSGPHAYKASALPTELSYLAPHKSFFMSLLPLLWCFVFLPKGYM